jgi:CBS domain containing-hemolysin-like protein
MDAIFGYRLIAIVLIVAVNGFFASAETALVSVRSSRLKRLAENRITGATAALALLSNPERLLSVVQVGVTLTSLALGWVGEATFEHAILAALQPVMVPAILPFVKGVSVVFAFLLMTFVHVVFGEVVPKNLAIGSADRFSVLVAPPLLVFYRLAEPMVWTIERASVWVSRAVGIRSEAHAAGHSREELQFIVNAGESAGQVTAFERKAITNLLDLQHYNVREVMVPRNQLVSVPADASIDAVLQVMSESHYSRLPVYEGSKENLIGIVHVKDVLNYWTERRLSNLKRRAVAPFDLKSIVRKVPVVPESRELHLALDDLRAQTAHVAFVVDEFGTISGMVSTEDLFEQVFGEIEDEFDAVQALPGTREDVFEVEGTTPIRDLDVLYGIELPTEADFETLAGFLMDRLGRIPAVGDVVEHEGIRFEVLEMDFNRIVRVRVERLPKPEAGGLENGEDAPAG